MRASAAEPRLTDSQPHCDPDGLRCGQPILLANCVTSSLVHEGMVDDRLLLGGQRLIKLIERRLHLLQPLQPGREELLAPVDLVEDRLLTAYGGRQ